MTCLSRSHLLAQNERTRDELGALSALRKTKQKKRVEIYTREREKKEKKKTKKKREKRFQNASIAGNEEIQRSCRKFILANTHTHAFSRKDITFFPWLCCSSFSKKEERKTKTCDFYLIGEKGERFMLMWRLRGKPYPF